ncbi:hypothetical protein BT67DRAFT_30101 [Trichocladium antarcticum]|uniref:Uncharacterized protein n=1 Tax=Trichocladium antarcticum TaxID=1450529 RepID=A0AAN6UW81_9PEZI|nr:hypothetical protein BT67DRAFT_30101 [Trichocladium antarcticum]
MNPRRVSVGPANRDSLSASHRIPGTKPPKIVDLGGLPGGSLREESRGLAQTASEWTPRLRGDCLAWESCDKFGSRSVRGERTTENGLGQGGNPLGTANPWMVRLTVWRWVSLMARSWSQRWDIGGGDRLSFGCSSDCSNDAWLHLLLPPPSFQPLPRTAGKGSSERYYMAGQPV